eukprot:357392-Chlamydomonas_euryale.AAC.35
MQLAQTSAGRSPRGPRSVPTHLVRSSVWGALGATRVLVVYRSDYVGPRPTPRIAVSLAQAYSCGLHQLH